MLGNLPRFVTRSELTDHHIVTYSFGDQEALYLRGQWTVHQNLPNVNAIWQGCEHLSVGLEQEVAAKIAWVRRNEAAGRITYHKRFLSAEGCYSHRAMLTSGIKIKIAQKQFTGLEREEHAQASVYLIRGALWLCDSKSTSGAAADALADEPDLRALAAASEDKCDHTLPEVHPATGEEEAVQVGGTGCGAWVPPEFRICAESLKGRTQTTVVRRNGEFYSQSFERVPSITAEGGRCRQGAFFHMQEWKKRWEDGLPHIDPAAAYDTFKLDQNGIHRLELPP